MVRRFSQFATRHTAFIQLRRFRPLGRLFFEATLRSLLLRPDDLLTILTMALSIDLRDLVSLLPSIQATRFRLLPRWAYLPLNTSAFLFLFWTCRSSIARPTDASGLRFTRHLAMSPARLEARMESLFSFPVGLLHPLQHAGCRVRQWRGPGFE